MPMVDIEATPDETKKITGANVKSQILAGHKDLTTGVHGVGSNYIPQAPAASHLVRTFTKGWTSDKLVKGAGVDADPVETILTYDLCEIFLLPYYLHRKLSRFIHNVFLTYDMISTTVTGSGSVSQPFYQPDVSTGTTSGSTSQQRLNGLFGWLSGACLSLFYGWGLLLNTNYAEGFIGMTPNDTGVPLLTYTDKHCGFILVKSASEDTIYASNADGTTQTKTDLGVTAAAQWHHLRIESDTAGNVYFYVDNVLKATHTTNLNPDAMTWKISIKNNAAADNKVYFENFMYGNT